MSHIVVGIVAMNTNRTTVRKTMYFKSLREKQEKQVERPHKLVPYAKLVKLHIDGSESKARMPRAKGLDLAKRQALQRQKDRVYRMLHPMKDQVA